MSKHYDLLIEWKKLLVEMKCEVNTDDYYNQGIKGALEDCISEFPRPFEPNCYKIQNDIIYGWIELAVLLKKDLKEIVEKSIKGYASKASDQGHVDQLEICILQFINLLGPEYKDD